MKFSIKEWQDKTLNEGWGNVRIKGLEDLKDGYYGIADELADMKAHIEAVRNNPDGMDWETDKLGKGGFRKEIILFQKMERLFNTSQLGKVL